MKAEVNQKNIASLLKPYRVTSGKNFHISNIHPADTQQLRFEKEEATLLLQQSLEQLALLQDKLYASDHWALLLIFQAMDAAGKDSTIKHVMCGINPQGCQVFSFKQPSAEELDHDYLWRYIRCLPERGRLGIFNRSYYEEVLVVRVHKSILQAQRVPSQLITKDIWKERLEDIRSFERYLSRNGTVILKFFLHVSRKEQKKRFLERLDRPEKNWKFSAADVEDRKHWDAYMNAYEEAIKATATSESPWLVVPADNKWFTRLVVSAAVVDSLQQLNLEYPKVDDNKRKELDAARHLLMGRSGGTKK